jgi:hypothetical protein
LSLPSTPPTDRLGRRTTANSTVMMKMPIAVAADMPPMTATPTAWRAPAPAPVVIQEA